MVTNGRTLSSNTETLAGLIMHPVLYKNVCNVVMKLPNSDLRMPEAIFLKLLHLEAVNCFPGYVYLMYETVKQMLQN